MNAKLRTKGHREPLKALSRKMTPSNLYFRKSCCSSYVEVTGGKETYEEAVAG